MTARLTLRPFAPTDEAAIRRLAGDGAIADTTLNIPHPYPEGAAAHFIRSQLGEYDAGTAASFAVVERSSGELVGACGMNITPRFAHAEMGYWIARDRWDRGYATEAAAALLRYAFAVRGLHRVYARHMTRNPQSGKVMVKLGMTWEGRQREHVLKNGVFEDLEVFGLLRDEWLGRREEGEPGGQ